MKKMVVFGLILAFILTLNTYGETSSPLTGYWEATQINVDGEDMDLTGAFGEFLSASVEFTDQNTFTITTSYFGDIVKQKGSYAVSDGNKIVAFYVDGKLSTGKYEYVDETLVLEESIGGELITLYLKQAEKPYTVGDIVTFGAYEQDNNTSNGKEPIEWMVLDVQGDKALLISRCGLDAKPYNTSDTDVTWETCTLRKWLNEDFLGKAFTAQEQSAILTTKVDNSESQGYWSTNGGNNTQDRIFLLSYAEANKYFNVTREDSNNTKSRVAPTAYAIKQGAFTSSSYKTAEREGSGWWWLRSPGSSQYNAVFVLPYGSLHYDRVNSSGGVVRPAFYINLNSLIND